MGINVSKEVFGVLENFAKKDINEQSDILLQANMNPEEEDERIADFLRASGTYVGLIRGIVTTCIFKFQKHLNTNQHEIKRFTELIRKIYNENSIN
ncbi:hypothetical protein GLOIN_2v1479673 [Rhizophagus irregularis DAOM 181602=DAOM 197198]|nr:hypothetical protein GLOIN_2v1479673 [Rhizophagus irregularis DAOM 181602=DAOM 197198]CAB4487190.1 unnamed protein product [Rhizophagus irregularis]